MSYFRLIRSRPWALLCLVFFLQACGGGTPSRSSDGSDTLSTSEFRIGAWNLHGFGPTKADRPEVMQHITQVLRRYDLVVLQEIRDSSGYATSTLLQQLNEQSPGDYAMLISDPLGRNTYKERYAFVYRQSRAVLLDSYLYEDGKEPFDTLMREPLVSLWQLNGQDLILVPNHLPADSQTTRVELEILGDVLDEASLRWAENKLLLLGDLNADCRYMSGNALRQSALRQDPNLNWLIGDQADTTVRQSTDCAYDRLVATDALMPWVKPNTAQAFDYPGFLNLSETDGLKVSDHYPVELILQPQ